MTTAQMIESVDRPSSSNQLKHTGLGRLAEFMKLQIGDRIPCQISQPSSEISRMGGWEQSYDSYDILKNCKLLFTISHPALEQVIDTLDDLGPGSITQHTVPYEEGLPSYESLQSAFGCYEKHPDVFISHGADHADIQRRRYAMNMNFDLTTRGPYLPKHRSLIWREHPSPCSSWHACMSHSLLHVE